MSLRQSPLVTSNTTIKEEKISDDPLTKVYTLFSTYVRSLTHVDTDLLKKARHYVGWRRVQLKQSDIREERRRIQLKWLFRWKMMIQRELDKRGEIE